jgi:hypothetical protein
MVRHQFPRLPVSPPEVAILMGQRHGKTCFFLLRFRGLICSILEYRKPHWNGADYRERWERRNWREQRWQLEKS